MFLKKFNILITMFLLLISGSLYASRSERTKIAVMDFETINVEQSVGKAVAESMRTSLFKTGKYSVIERSQLEKIIEEQKLQASGLADDEHLISAFRVSGVQVLVLGSVSKIGKTYTINSRFIDVEKGVAIKAGKVNCNNEDDIPLVLDDIVESIETGKVKKYSSGKKFGIGLGNPYLSLFYDINSKFMLETRYATHFKGEVDIGLLRFYYKFMKMSDIDWYIVPEAGLLQFMAREIIENMYYDTRYKGQMFGIYVGGNHYFNEWLALNIDIGASYINLNNGQITDIDCIINTGVFIYLF